MQTITFAWNDPKIAAICDKAFPDRNRKAVTVRVTDAVELQGLYWSGGSRSTYRAVTLDGQAQRVDIPQANPAAFGGPVTTPELPLTPEFVVVESSTFCGKDMGLVIYVHPLALAPLLPAPGVDLSPAEQIVVNVTCSLIPSARKAEAEYLGVPANEYDAVRESLKAKGLLDKRGAITPAGRNARGK